MKKSNNNAKNMIMALILLIPIFSFTLFQLTQEKDLLIGVWFSVDSPNWKWEFKTDGKCYEHYENNLEAIYIYSIETTSPQCDIEVDEGPSYSYLKISSTTDTEIFYCYEVLSLNDEFLQIRALQSNNIITFRKQ
ncbi:MAG: hypothetical protein NDI80_01650 [Flavobacteriaceae bacterium]|nr:hypothetical protein [Flavobacteriaceae bacterium]